jgi:uncharacterized protein YceK
MKKTLIALAVVALCAGCATTKGLEISDADAKECAEVGCTPWSERQLEGMARHFFGLGVKAGIARQKGSI